MDRYYRDTRKTPPAEVQNFLVEYFFAKEFGWTPDQVRSVDYRWIQMFYATRNRKEMVQEVDAKAKKHLNDFKNKTKPKARR